jgi:hypothetical protein
MKRREESAQVDNARPDVGGSGIKGRAVHKSALPESTQIQSSCRVAPMLQNNIQRFEKSRNQFLAPKNSCPNGQNAHLGTAIPSVREPHHSIISSHRIRFGLPRVTTAAGHTSPCRTARLPQRISYRRLNLFSRKTGDQNASSV